MSGGAARTAACSAQGPAVEDVDTEDAEQHCTQYRDDELRPGGIAGDYGAAPSAQYRADDAHQQVVAQQASAAEEPGGDEGDHEACHHPQYPG